MIPKFRAYDKKTKKVRDVLVIDWLNGLVDLSEGNIDYDIENDVILMQSTGLKDKNGVEIFEGDILVYDAPKKYAHRRSMHEIAYADGRFFWEFLDLVFCQSNILYRDGYLVIGNIHENPELLEVK